jgi:hypothetical protein
MFRFQSIFSLLLISFLSQAARGEVVEDIRYGPSCNAPTHSCLLILKLQGEITVADYEKTKRLIDETDRQAKSKKNGIGIKQLFILTLRGAASMQLWRLEGF